MIAFLFIAAAYAEQACSTFHKPADVVEAAMRVQGARMADVDDEAERRTLLMRLACVSDPLDPADAAAVHLALGSGPYEPLPAPTPDDALDGPPHPDGGVALVDGQAYAALRPGRAAVVQAFDADGRMVYTRWLDGAETSAVRRGDVTLPTSPTLPKLPPTPLRGGEIARLVGSGALLAVSGGLFAVAAKSRADWYAIEPSHVDSVGELEGLRVRTNVAQGAGLACAGLGAAGLLSVAVRVPF